MARGAPSEAAAAGERGGAAPELSALALPIAGAVGFRFACFAAMQAAAVWNERRPAPGALPDLALQTLPYVPAVARANYLLWLAVYLPLAVALLAEHPRRWVRYMVTGGLVSLARGGTLLLTGLGAPDPAHAGPGLGDRGFWQAWAELVSPWAPFARGGGQAYLTKDLFFSGHAATTFLLALYLWPRRGLRWAALAGHALVVASVLLARLHYAIDVAGAWAITFAVFVLREGWPAPRRARPA
ncbi:MAG TPA: phosphatase PAP2-related protein [Anaeromyxobacteraceae bacterium]|nr:phosphatase PAP2-related protein [Anaeromyxobacteraceae bacterium]